MDKIAIKNFWDAQGIKSDITSESISNLEENPALSNLKVESEKLKIMPMVKERVSHNSSILDLGGGAGQWAIRFSSLVRAVTIVEFSEPMLDLAIHSATKKNITNINFINSDAQNFYQSYDYDLIWISGLLIYLDDIDCNQLVSNCYKMLASDGSILLRDGTGLGQRHEIKDQFSVDLNQNYSATYRTEVEYKELFLKHGFNMVSSEDMFQESSPLNKWHETRLRVYEFKK